LRHQVANPRALPGLAVAEEVGVFNFSLCQGEQPDWLSRVQNT